MASYESRYYKALMAGLLLFGFSLALSKSACNILLFLLYITAVIFALYGKNFRKAVLDKSKQPLTLAMTFYFIVAFVGIFYTEKYADGIHVANKFLSLPAIYFIVSVLIQADENEDSRFLIAEYLLLSFLVGLALLNAIGVMTYLGIVGDKKYVLPLAPMHVHHIWFSNINALGLYAAAAFLLYSRRGLSRGGKVFFFFSIALAVLCILLSTSRTAWFGILLTSVVMAFLITESRRIFFITAAGVAAVCVAAYLFIPFVHERIHMIGSDISHYSAGDVETSLGARFLMWKAAILMFLSNPLIGVGSGDYVPTMAAYVSSGQFPDFLLEFNQPHNMYLFALATNGLLGLAALLYMFYRALKFTLPVIGPGEGAQDRKKERLFAFVAAATAIHFMIAGLTDSFFNIQILRYAFVFILGVCVRTSTVVVHRD